MPELPEVETIKNSLQPLLKDEIIRKVDVYYPGILRNMGSEEFASTAKDRCIKSVQRRGKYLLITLTDGYTLIIHLKMSGQLVVTSAGEPVLKHTHLIFHLCADKQLRYIDTRKFGMIFLVPDDDWSQTRGLRYLGPEPLGEEFTPKVLADALAERQIGIKAFLLDQSMIAGIGNIYADEILFAAGIDPRRRTRSLNDKEKERLYCSIRNKLTEGIANRGTTLRDYIDGLGGKGGFQAKLEVYGRKNKLCNRCGNELTGTVCSGRSTVYCPNCQK